MPGAVDVPFSWKRAKPLDLSFEGLESLGAVGELRAVAAGFVSSYRMRGLPPSSADGRYKTASVLLNGNRLTGGLEGIRSVLDRLLYRPDALCWLDVSRNRLTDVADELLEFPNLRTLYAHHNDLASLCAVRGLNRLPALRSLTLQNNPVAAVCGYRPAVLFLLPRLSSLDFVVVTDSERRQLPPVSVRRAANEKTNVSRPEL